MAKMITNYATSVLHKVPDDSLSCEFDDMRYESQEMQFYAKLACQLHLMGIGSDGSVAEKFNPHGLVTRAEF